MSVKFSNNAKTTLSSGVTSSATSITVADGSVFPSISGSEYFYVTLVVSSDLDLLEIVKVTAISGNTLTITRGQDGTSARTFSSGDKCELRLNAAALNDAVLGGNTTEMSLNQFTGDGSTTAFTLSSSPDENLTNVFLSGVYQSKSNYSISGSSLTFSTAPPNGLAIEVMVAEVVEFAVNVVADDSVTSDKLSNALSTKIAGIEASADVTDTANVTAAGALMDSELTSEASVKALNQGVATGDSPTFAGVTLATADIDGGTIDGTAIGASSASTGAFTTLTASGTFTASGTAVVGGLQARANGNIEVGGYNGGTDYGLILTPADGSTWWHMYNDAGGHLAFGPSSTVGSAEKARLTSGGDLLVGQTSNAETGTGIGLVPDGTSHMYSGGTDALMLGRGGSDGDILSFNKSGTTVGSIGSASGGKMSVIGANQNLQIGANGTNVFNVSTTSVYPQTDNAVDLGFSSSSNRFKDLHLSGTANVGVSRITGQNLAHSASTLVIGHEGSSKSQLRAYGANSSTTGSLEFMVSNSSGGGSHSMVLDSSGNVNIGSTNSGVSGALDVSIGSTSSAGGITLWSPTNSRHSLGFGDGYTGTDRYRGYVEYSHSDDSMRLGTGATERMRIHASGAVTKPYQPSTAFTCTNTITLTNDSTWRKIALNKVIHQTGGSHFSTSNNRFTAPVAGRYLFGMDIQLESVSGTITWMYIVPFVNGSFNGNSGAATADFQPPAQLYNRRTGTFLLNLSANDYVDLYHIGAGNGTVNVKPLTESAFFLTLL